MAAPIRPSDEISLIINKSQHAIADVGLELIRAEKRGEASSRSHKDKMYQLILLRIYLQNILNDDGVVINYYSSSENEKKFNRVLDGLAKLSEVYGGAAIPLLTGKRIPLVYYPSTAGISTGGNPNSGGGQATPGGTTFENSVINGPSEVVDQFDASSSNFALLIYAAHGSNSGEGSRSGIIVVSIRSGNASHYEVKTPDNGGITTPLTFSVQIASGKLQLIANVTTNGWLVRGTRILFQNITFQNPLGPLPTGGTIGQFLKKIGVNDFDAAFADISQTDVANLVADLAAKLALAGGTMSGAIAMGGNKITDLAAASANGEAVRYEQLPSSLPPSGPAGGDLAGTYPNPTLAQDRVRKTSDVMSGSLEIQGGFRTQASGVYFKVITIDIGNWNMDTLDFISITHGLSDFKKVRNIGVIIRNDSDNDYRNIYQVNFLTGLNTGGSINAIGATTVILSRIPGGAFDGATYSNDSAFNRGWITIIYEA